MRRARMRAGRERGAGLEPPRRRLRAARDVSFLRGQRLACRAPVRSPCAVALPKRANRLAAARARASRPAVDPPRRPFAVDRLAHQATRLEKCRAKRVVREIADRCPRRDARVPQRLRPPDVSDPGDDALIEQRVADLTSRIAASQACEDPVEVGRVGEDVGSEPGARARVELEDGTVPEDGLEFVPAQQEPRPTGAALTAGTDAPSPGHPQVASDGHPALEAKEEVLPGRLDREERQPVDPLRHPRNGGARVRRLGFDTLSHQHLQAACGAVERVAFGHAWKRMGSRTRSAVAGAVSATAWGILEPVDQRLFRCDYSDIALLGKAVSRHHWRPVGFAWHAANGALFGVAYAELRSRTGWRSRHVALGLALAEHVALYPLAYLVDRFHPARGEPGVPALLRNPRAFAQAGARHALFGLLFGRLG